MSLIGKEVYIKFGKYHGMKGEVVGETVRNSDGVPFVAVAVPLEGESLPAMVIKKQRNVVVFGGVQYETSGD